MITENLLKADIDITGTDANTIISAPSGTSEYIEIDHINLVPTADTTVQFKDGTTDYGGAYPLKAGGIFVLSEDKVITLSAGNAFTITLGTDTQTSGFVRYRIINR